MYDPSRRSIPRFRPAALLLAACLLPSLGAQDLTTGEEQSLVRWSRSSSIDAFEKRHVRDDRPITAIDIPAALSYRSEGASLSLYPGPDGQGQALAWRDESGWVEYDFTVAQAGIYRLAIEYLPLESKGMPVEFAIYIDGELPYSDAQSVLFTRIWKDASGIRHDDFGNDLRPRQVEAPAWSMRDCIDTQGFYNRPLPFALSQGRHRLRLELRREPVAMARLRFYNPPKLASYAELSESFVSAGYPHAPKPSMVKVQAELPFRKSDAVLVASYDRSDAITEPQDAAKIKMNTIGGQWTWKQPGQWVEYEIDAPASGLYKVFIRGRQNFQRGVASTRILSVDGQVPCQEFNEIEFPYSLNWRIVVPGGKKNPELIYLSQGRHTLKLEASLGRLSPILSAVDDLTYEANTIRRRFIMIMGAEPDRYRDYQLDKEIPGLKDKLLTLSRRFMDQADEFERITGQKGTEAEILRRVSRLLKDFAYHPENIPLRQSSFRDNIAGLAAWILYRKEIPLEIDYLGIASADARLPSPTASPWIKAWMDLKSFVASFTVDYNNIGRKEGKGAIDVWISSGRDQAQILKDLINDSFTPETGVKVNLSLVQGSLIEATLAGRGPEIGLYTSRVLPVNLASRGVLYDLSSFPDFKDTLSRFTPGATVPYEYRGGTYALPFTQNFHMLFYRKDIFKELGLKAPDTWQDLFALIPVLQRNNMQIGLAYQQSDTIDLIDAGIGARNIFPTLLLQNGADFYEDDGRRTGLNNPAALAAFKRWTDFYVAYGFERKFDFYSRFRTGEMPIGIASYTLYNQLQAAAPEIRNEWEMLPIPGTQRPDGSVDRAEAASGGSAIMFRKIKDPKAGWEFLRWWLDGETQLQYVRSLETLLGPAARLDTANRQTFDRMAWSKKEAAAIKGQWDAVREIREVPGGYYTSRMVDTAFSRVVDFNWNTRWTMSYYGQMIDDELKRKEQELGNRK